MKILIATGIYPPSVGGPATYSKTLFEELPKRGVGVEVLSYDEVRGLPKIIRHAAYFLKTISRAKGCDIVYAQDPVSVGLPALFACKILGKRFLLKVVGDYAWEQGAQRFGVKDNLDDFVKNSPSENPLFVRIMIFVERLVASRAEKVIVPSRYLKKIVAGWGVSEEKIKVVYNAFEEVPDSANGERGRILLNGKAVISAGRLVPWKGFLTLVDVMAELVRKFPDLKLYILGDGPDKGKIEKSIKQLNLSKNVFLAGSVPRQALFDYLRQGSVFALNTAYEGFSHQLLEALYLGIPVVTTDAGGNPEIIENGKNGLLVPVDDKRALSSAIERMLRDDEFSASCVSSGREEVSRFTKEKMIDGLIEVIT